MKRKKTIGQPKIYAYGNLVLWTNKKDLDLSTFLASTTLMQSKSIRHIAVANPQTAPYGAAAIEVLEHHKLYSTIEEKLVYGESIAQTNQFITTGSAELGFTAKSVVLSPRVKALGQWIEIDPEIYQAIAQGVVLLKTTEDRHTQAQKFYNFLFSPKAKEILNNFGYKVI